MKANIFLFSGVLLFPIMLAAQDHYWFKKGMSEKKPGKQVEYFTKSLETEGAAAETYVHRGDAYRDIALDIVYNHHGIVIEFGNGDAHNAPLMYERARADYTRAIKLDPKYADAYINRSEIYWQQGMNDKALADLSCLIKIDSLNAKAYFKRAFIYQNNYRDFPKAISDLSRAVEIDPSFKDAYYSRAFVCYRTKQYDEAMADLNKTIDIDPNYFWAYCKRGDVYRHFRQFEKAIADYEKTIGMDSRNFMAYNNRGCIYLLQSQYEKAMKDFRKAISCNSKNMQPYCNIGYLCLQQNKLEDALKYIQKSLDLVENFIDAHLDMALVYYAMGNYSEAKNSLEKARTIAPRLPEEFDGLSKLESGGHDWNDRDKETLKKMFRELH
jgi:tetratricopeptide (TPR) repeat protein